MLLVMFKKKGCGVRELEVGGHVGGPARSSCGIWTLSCRHAPARRMRIM